jgi:hypothetical protein
MALRPDQIMHEVQSLLDVQIRMTMSGAINCLTDAQWREYNKREAQIASLLRELDAATLPELERKMPYPEANTGRPLRRAS